MTTAYAVLGSNGRIVIPKAIMNALCLKIGDHLAFEIAGERVTMYPVVWKPREELLAP